MPESPDASDTLDGDGGRDPVTSAEASDELAESLVSGANGDESSSRRDTALTGLTVAMLKKTDDETDDSEDDDKEMNESSSKLPPTVQKEIDDLLLKFADIKEGAFFSEVQKRDVIKLLACLREYKHLLEGELTNIRAKGTIIGYAEKMQIDPLSDLERLALERLKVLVQPKTGRVLPKNQKPIYVAIIRLLRKGNRDTELEAFLEDNNIINTNRWNLERTRMGILTADLAPAAFLPPVVEAVVTVAKPDAVEGMNDGNDVFGKDNGSDHVDTSHAESEVTPHDAQFVEPGNDQTNTISSVPSVREHLNVVPGDNLSSLVEQNRMMVSALLDTNLPPATAEAFRRQLTANNAVMSALVGSKLPEGDRQSGSSVDQSSSDDGAVLYQAANGGRVRIDSNVQGFVVVLDGNNLAKADS